MRSISIEFKVIIVVIFFTLFIVSIERYQLSKNIINQFIESKKSKNSLLINTISPIIALNISLGLERANSDYLEQIVAQNSDLEFIELKNSNVNTIINRCKFVNNYFTNYYFLFLLLRQCLHVTFFPCM